MSMSQKMDYVMSYVVNDCYCDFQIFAENVLKYMPTKEQSLDFWKDKIKAANTEKDLRKVVCLYI